MAVEYEEEATLSYSIRGYHVYRAMWSAALGEILQRERELDNVHDRYAICVMRHGTIIHNEFLAYAHYFSKEAGKFPAKLRDLDDIYPSYGS